MITKPMGALRRPLDFYVAFLVFLIGLYGLVDQHWPPEASSDFIKWILNIEDVYLVLAGTMIMVSLVLRDFRIKIVQSLVCEMFGWAGIASAAWVITITSFWIPPAVFIDPQPQDTMALISATWITIWAGLAAAASLRYFDMRRWLSKECGK